MASVEAECYVLLISGHKHRPDQRQFGKGTADGGPQSPEERDTRATLGLRLDQSI
jgi:hypothetical protein